MTTGMIADEARLETHCRMWLLAIAVLHWIVFFLLVSQSAEASSRTLSEVSDLARAAVQSLGWS